jgi:hypothetical protein
MMRHTRERHAEWRGIAFGVVVLAWVGAPGMASSLPYTACGGAGRPICTGPGAGPVIPTAPRVPGKEHNTAADRSMGNMPPLCGPNPGQDVAWDGIGGTEDSFDYEAGDVADTDAMANRTDALYGAVISDTAALVFSVDGDPDLTVEPTGAAGGSAAGATWAVGTVDIEGDAACPAADIDGVEVWGPDPQPGSDDGNRFSRVGDPFDSALPPSGGRTSVYAHAGAVPLCATAALAASMGALLAATPTQTADLAANLDLDALMTAGPDPEQSDGDAPSPGTAPPMMMWSVRPITVAADGGSPAITLDGGEIFVGDCLGTPAAFLTHGGHLWDTAFPVATTFGLGSENVNALEAVARPLPVPSMRSRMLVLLTVVIAGTACLGLLRMRRA